MGALRKLSVSRPNKSKMSFGRFYGVDLRTDGETGGFNRASECYNFSTADGALKINDGGVGFGEKYVLPKYEPISLYFYKRRDSQTGKIADLLMIYCNDGFIYSCPYEGGEFKLIPTLHFYNRPIGILYNYNGNDAIIFSSNEGYFRIYDGSTTITKTKMPIINSMCMHAERLFFTSSGIDGALWFSDDFDPLNWNVSLSEAGFIDMSDERGEMIGVVNFANYLFVFRSYGISKVTAYADQTEFSVTHLLTSCGKIVKNSIVNCGEYLTFVASDGIYRFDGYSISKISEHLNGKIDFLSVTAKGVFFNGYVYYVFENTKTGEKTILKSNLSGGDYSFINAGDICDFAVINAENEYRLFGVDKTQKCLFEVVKSGKYLDVPTEKVWRSKKSDFGITARVKNLTEIAFYVKGKCTVTVCSEKGQSEFTVNGKGRTVLRPNLKGNIFEFEIKSNEEEVEVSGLTVTFSYYL